MTIVAIFLIMRAHSLDNAIIYHPTLKSFKVITSTYHLKIKFSTKMGIRKVQGEQTLVRECHVQEMTKRSDLITLEKELMERIPHHPLMDLNNRAIR